MPRYSNEQIIEMLKNLAERLGQTSLSKTDISSVISVSNVYGRFGNIGNALEAAGLERTDPAAHFRNRGQQLEDGELFSALYRVESSIGHEPGFNECSVHCKYSVRPYKQRFGKWSEVLAHYRKWKSENDNLLPSLISDTANNGDDFSSMNGNEKIAQTSPRALPIGTSRKKAPEQFYGEPHSCPKQRWRKLD